MGGLLPSDERASLPDDALGDAIAAAVIDAISDAAHVAVVTFPLYECPACDALSDDDPAAVTDY